MAAPAFAAAGAMVGTATSGAAHNVPCPATVNAGELLIAHLSYEGTTVAPTDPSGWTLLSGPHGAATMRQWIYGRIADGTEDGTNVNFGSPANTNNRYGRIYSFSGVRDDTGWVAGGDGFLVIDRNRSGTIDSAAELSFGGEDPDAKSDLEALARLDSNADGVIDANDARFGELRVWRDANGNGLTETGELLTLEASGIASIGLAGRAGSAAVKPGENILISTATFTRTGGATGTASASAVRVW